MSLSFARCAVLLCTGVALWAADPAERTPYQAPTWKPRAILPAADALRGDFWPASPARPVSYDDPGFDESRLPPLPAAGVHPRVLVTPDDVERIRAKVALGDKAPAPFQVMWKRAAANKSAFYALVAKDDALGRRLAADLVAKIATLEPKLDKLDQQADRDNLWAVERSLIASGDPNPPSEIWALLDYDYLHGWMSPEERESARRVIARLTAGRITNFMTYPDHFMINNHQGFGMEYLRLLLLIEGEQGYDQRVFDLGAHKARAMLDWYLSKDGMCYESIKGWLNISAFTAVGLRQRDLLKHGHLRAKMDFFRAALKWEDGDWHIRDEMRASAFHVIWMMHHYHPQDQAIDLLYRSTFTSHDFLVDAKAKWLNPVGIVEELLLLYADDGITDASGKPQDWTDQARIDGLKLPVTWRDDTRGYLMARNTWRKDDLQVGFTCKQDFFYGGHEGSENNRITLWAGGVNWIQDINMLAIKATALQNMVTIDGKGLQWPPAPGVWLGTQESAAGVTSAADGRNGYSYSKRMQVHPLDFPSTKLAYYAPFAEGNFDLTRDLQVAFHPGTVRWNDGYAHTDYGPWSGETRLVEHYQQWNPMQRAYRTVHLARGDHPYVLVVDDLQKDEQKHLFEWNISLPPDADVIEADGSEIAFQQVEPTARREDRFLIGTKATARDAKTGRMVPKKGDPLLLVKVLWRNAPYGFPTPRFERLRGHNGTEFMGYGGFAHLSIPAIAVSPEFRVLVYPHRFGDPLPTTVWNADRSDLTVTIDKQVDRYRLAAADGGRTVLAMQRDSAPVMRSEAAPARPALVIDGVACDPADRRTTREEDQPFTHRFAGRTRLAFVRAQPPAVIRYTLDGSEPDDHSPLYEAPVPVSDSCTVKARRFDPAWVCGPTASAVTVAVFTREAVLPGLASAPAGSVPGLLARVYEAKTVMWNDRGFFDAAKVMLPDLERLQPAHVQVTGGVALPAVAPQRPVVEQVKGFYRWTGWFRAERAGRHVFTIDSCGPVTLDIDRHGVIDHRGIFHQQQAQRSGAATLEAGWHAIDLVVCDPLYWNLATLDAMPVSLTLAVDGAAPVALAAEQVRCLAAGAATAPAMTWHEALDNLPRMEPGVMLSVYQRDGMNVEPAYLDIDDQQPARTALVPTMEGNLRPALVRCYDGWFRVPAEGIHRFELPARRTENAGLGELRAAYQSQLRIDGEVVVQRGVAGRVAQGTVGLKAGWHHLSLRLGSSPAEISMTAPDGQTQVLGAASLFRPVQVAIRPQGVTTTSSRYEIYGPTAVTLELPLTETAVIRYTTDGSRPDARSPAYGAPLTIDGDTTITAVAFVDGQAISRPASAVITRVAQPTADLLALVDASVWTGHSGLLPLGGGASVWIDPTAVVEDGALVVNRHGTSSGPAVDANISHGQSRAGMRFSGLPMRDNALTVALRVRSDTGSGKLFGKDGITAFGKPYKTVWCSMANHRVQANVTASYRPQNDPGRLQSPALAPGWHDVVVTGDDRAVILYVDGTEVAQGIGSATLTTDSLDLLSEHAASVGWVRVYNRVLSPADVAQLSVRK